MAVVVLALSACATAAPRVENGIFRAPSLFRVTVPGPEWEVASTKPAEIVLRHAGSQAGIFANAECGDELARRDVAVLARRLFIGLRDRQVVENGTATLDGATAAHAVIDAQVSGRDDRLRLEAYVLKDARCVYDVVYAAPPETFTDRRADFQRFVESFVRE